MTFGSELVAERAEVTHATLDILTLSLRRISKHTFSGEIRRESRRRSRDATQDGDDEGQLVLRTTERIYMP